LGADGDRAALEEVKRALGIAAPATHLLGRGPTRAERKTNWMGEKTAVSDCDD